MLFMKIIFERNNIEFIHVINGAEAVSLFKEHPDISIILMDIKMPVMNGIEATQQIRQFNKTIPIIAQTAYVFEDDKVKILNAGCDGIISKPIKEKELIEMIYRLTKNK